MAWMLSFSLGVTNLLFVTTLFSVSTCIIAACFVIVLLLIIGTYRYWSHSFGFEINHYCKLAISCGLLFCLAISYAQWVANNLMQRQLSSIDDRSDFVVEGRIKGPVYRDIFTSHYAKYQQSSQAYRSSFLFAVKSIEPLAGCTSASKTSVCSFSPKIIRLTLYQMQQLKAGELWQFSVRLRSSRGLANPGGFDLQRYFMSQHIDAQGYVRQFEQAKRLGQSSKNWLDSLRAERIESMRELFEPLEYGGVLQAMLLGFKQKIGLHQKQLLQKTGTAHLVAISGLHISIAAGFGWWLSQWLSRLKPMLFLYLPSVYIGSFFSLSFAMYYAILAGLAISTQRALCMLTAAICSQCLMRNTSAYSHLLLALCLLLMLDPISLLSSGFWLSFFAVAILITVMRHTPNPSYALHNWEQSSNTKNKCIPYAHYLKKTLNSLYIVVKAQWGIFIAMPIILLTVGLEVSLLSPLANIVVVPVVTFCVVPLGLMALLMSYVSSTAAQWFLIVADKFIAAVFVFLEYIVNKASPLDTYYHTLSIVDLLLCIAVVFILLSRRKMPSYFAALILWVILFDPLNVKLKVMPTGLQLGDFVLTQIDVGQGTAILISTANNHWLYDTGASFSSQSDMGNKTIIPMLNYYGIKLLHSLVVSHADNDHAGGAKSIAKVVRVQNYVAGGKANNLLDGLYTKSIFNCQRGQAWLVDNIEFKVLHPHEKLETKENDRSCVIQVSSLNSQNKKAQVLLTGDISKVIEYQLAGYYGEMLSSDLLIVPHHGSQSSSSWAFINHVRPSFAMVSSGFNNHYHHPHLQVQKRYVAQGINFLRSDQLGAIQLLYKDGKWQGPFCQRYKAKHFWQSWDNSSQCEASTLSRGWIK